MPTVPADVADQTSAVRDVFERLLGGDLPTRGDYLKTVQGLHEITALVLLALGVIYLLQGWKAFKSIVMVNAVALGASLGTYFGASADKRNMEMFGGIAGGLLFGVLSWALLKGAIGVMSALAGGFAGYGLWTYGMDLAAKPALAAHAWVGAALGLISFGLLGLLHHKLMVMVFTGIQGSLMAVSGLLALLVKPYAWPQQIRGHLTDNIHLLPLLLVTPAVLGFSLQYIASAKKAKKKGGGDG